MSTDFSNQLSALFDDVAATIQPRADFGAARAGAANVPLAPSTASAGGGRNGRNLVAAAAAAALLLGGGVAAYQLSGGGDSVSTVTDGPVPVIDDDKTPPIDADGDEPDVTTPAEPEQVDAPVVEANGAAGVDVGEASERTAEIAKVDWESTPPKVVLEGSAPDGEPIGVFSLAGAADTTAVDGTWRVELELTTLDAAPQLLLVIVEFADGDSVHLFVERPKVDEPDSDQPKAEEPDGEQPKQEEPKVDEPKVEPKPDEPKPDEPKPVAFAALLGDFSPMNEPPKVLLHGTAPAGTKVVASSPYGEQDTVAGAKGGWELWLYLWDIGYATTAPIKVTHPATGGVAEFSVTTPERPGPPKDVAFTAKVVEGGTHEGVVWRRFGGTAKPGSIVHASSAHGTATTTTGEQGEWTLKLWLEGAPPASNIGVQLSNSVSEAVHTFTVETPPAPEPPKQLEFTATVVEGGTHLGTVWRRFGGTATPGSTVSATSDYGTASATVPESGEWTLKLWLEGAPPASNIGVQLTNSASATVHPFTIETPAAPPTVEFSANAALTESSGNPAVNEYWGTAQPGSVIVISSPYGGAERTAGDAGGWDARIEFADAPIGEVFVVKVKSLATGQVKEFAMKRVE